MKITFNSNKLEELFSTPLEKLGKEQFSKSVIKNYQKRIKILLYADDLSEVAKLKGMNLEKLKSKSFKNCYSVRINDQFRVIFRKNGQGGVEILILELSKHYE